VESLLTSFRRERQKEETKTGCGADEAYKSSWFAFKSMLFLRGKYAVMFQHNTSHTSEPQRIDWHQGLG
jgi:hypothetical protein